MAENPAQRAVMGNFNLEAALPNGKKFSVSGYLFDGESYESLNARIDLLHDVVDRQRTRAEIPELEMRYKQKVQQLTDYKDHMTGLSAQKDKGKPLSSTQKEALGNMSINIEKLMADIADGAATGRGAGCGAAGGGGRNARGAAGDVRGAERAREPTGARTA